MVIAILVLLVIAVVVGILIAKNNQKLVDKIPDVKFTPKAPNTPKQQ